MFKLGIAGAGPEEEQREKERVILYLINFNLIKIKDSKQM